MARIVYQDQVYVMPDGEMDGDELLRELKVPPDHDLVLVRPEGNLLVSRRRKVHPVDDDYFVDAPTFEYGSIPGMARPIPINETGMRRRRRFDAPAFAPAWGVTQRAPPASPDVGSGGRSSFGGQVLLQALLLVSGLAGGLAVVSALGLWPELAATSLGLNEQGAFYLLVGGVYLLATTLYAAWRTRLLHDLNQAPWDARLMAYANLAVGGAVGLMLGAVVLTVAVIIVALVLFGALLLSGTGGQTQD